MCHESDQTLTRHGKQSTEDNTILHTAARQHVNGSMAHDLFLKDFRKCSGCTNLKGRHQTRRLVGSQRSIGARSGIFFRLIVNFLDKNFLNSSLQVPPPLGCGVTVSLRALDFLCGSAAESVQCAQKATYTEGFVLIYIYIYIPEVECVEEAKAMGDFGHRVVAKGLVV